MVDTVLCIYLQVKRAVFATLIANNMQDNAHIRLTLTRGEKVKADLSLAKLHILLHLYVSCGMYVQVFTTSFFSSNFCITLSFEIPVITEVSVVVPADNLGNESGF